VTKIDTHYIGYFCSATDIPRDVLVYFRYCKSWLSSQQRFDSLFALFL